MWLNLLLNIIITNTHTDNLLEFISMHQPALLLRLLSWICTFHACLVFISFVSVGVGAGVALNLILKLEIFCCFFFFHFHIPFEENMLLSYGCELCLQHDLHHQEMLWYFWIPVNCKSTVRSLSGCKFMILERNS